MSIHKPVFCTVLELDMVIVKRAAGLLLFNKYMIQTKL